MSYIGRGIDQIDNISTLDNLTFNGSDATFNLTQNSVAFVPVSADALQIQIDGVIQSGNYTVSGSTVTFDFTPSGSSVCNGIKHFGVGLLTTVSDGAVTTAKLGADSVNGTKIADDSISDEHLDITAITGQTEKTSLADADKFLISDSADSNALKYVQKSNLPSGTLVQTGRTLISGGNPSGIDVNNCFSSTYDTYLVVIDRIESTVDSQRISFRLRDSGGSVTASNYRHGNRFFDDDGSGVESLDSNARNKFDFTNDTDDSSNNGGLQGIMYVHRPADANTMTRMNAHYSFFNNTANDLKVAIAACNFDNPEEHTGIGMNISSGGIRDGGSLTVYGIKYS